VGPTYPMVGLKEKKKKVEMDERWTGDGQITFLIEI
jgi:hypothetical protein